MTKLKLDQSPLKDSIQELSLNKALTPEHVENNIDLNWDFFKLTYRNDIVERLLHKYPNKGWDYKLLATRKSTTMQFIIDNYQLPWGWKQLSNREDLDWKLFELRPDAEWNYEDLSVNPNIDWRLVIKYPHKKWNWHHLSRIVPIDIYLRHQKFYKKAWNNDEDEGEDWTQECNYWVKEQLCYNKNVNIATLMFNSEAFDFSKMHLNPNITVDFIKECDNLPWDFQEMSKWENFDSSLLDVYPEADWNFDELSNKISSWDYYFKFNDKPWNVKKLALNQHLLEQCF